MVFEVIPPILKYLRKKKIVESQAAKELIISEQPLKPVATINFKPADGLVIETGFQAGEDKSLITEEDIELTKDGNYTRIGNTFFPIPKLSPNIQAFLKASITTISNQSIPEFFKRDYVLLSREMNAVLVDQAKDIRIIRESLVPVVHVTKDPKGWLDFDVSYMNGTIRIPHATLSKAITQGEEFIQTDPSTWVQVDNKIFVKTDEQLEKLGAISTETGFRIPAHEFASLEEFIEAVGGHSELDKAYQEFLSKLTGFVPDDNFALPEIVENYLAKQNLTLRPYQRGGIQWLNWLRENHLHGILADDMGLGKTLQALITVRIGLLEENDKQNHVLIVAPKSVLIHWQREIDRVFPIVRICIYHGTNRNQAVFLSNNPSIILTTYETLS